MSKDNREVPLEYLPVIARWPAGRARRVGSPPRLFFLPLGERLALRKSRDPPGPKDAVGEPASRRSASKGYGRSS